MPFLADPLPECMSFHQDDTEGNTIQKNNKSFGNPTSSKVLLIQDPLRPFPVGYWFEIEISSFKGGFLQDIGLGFTQSTPEELQALASAESYPTKANKLPNTWVLGYQASLWWNGTFVGLDKDTCRLNLRPYGWEKVGLLLTTSGELQVFVNRAKLFTASLPEDQTAIPTDKPLHGVVDMCGGCERIKLCSSTPPSEEEQQAAAAAMAAKKGPAKKAAEAEEAPAAPPAAEAAEAAPAAEAAEA